MKVSEAGLVPPRTDESAPRAALFCAGWLTGAALTSVLMLGVWSGGFYSPASWVLAALLAVAGVVLAIVARDGRRAWWGPVAVVGAVMAAQVAGTGLVATKHWGTYFGYTGLYEHLFALKLLAVFAAGLSAVAVVVVVLRLFAWGYLAVAVGLAARWAAVIGGGVLLVAVPVGMGSGAPVNQDASSLLAFALIWSLPWAAAIMATGWMTRPVALAALAAVVVSILLSASARPMVALISGDTPRQPFLWAVLLVTAVGIVRLLARRPE